MQVVIFAWDTLVSDQSLSSQDCQTIKVSKCCKGDTKKPTRSAACVLRSHLLPSAAILVIYQTAKPRLPANKSNSFSTISPHQWPRALCRYRCPTYTGYTSASHKISFFPNRWFPFPRMSTTWQLRRCSNILHTFFLQTSRSQCFWKLRVLQIAFSRCKSTHPLPQLYLIP